LKNIISIILLFLFATLIFSGCALQLNQIDSLMRPPMAYGDYRKLQEVFYKTVGKDIALKCPQGGEYRSSFVLYDIDNDKEDEAIVFYVSRNEKSVARVNVLNKSNNQWQSVADLPGSGAAVESVRFTNMNDDAVPEMLISWKIDEIKLNSSLNIYSCFEQDGKLEVKDLLSASYTLLEPLDIDSDGKNEVFIVHLDRLAVIPQAYAKAYKMINNNDVVLMSQTKLDGNIVSYNEIKTGKISDGNPLRIYIDAYKGETQAITEMVYWDVEKKALSAPLLNPQTQSNILTLRNNRIPSADINNDGIVDIPIQEILEGVKNLQAENEKADLIYITKWINVTDDGNAAEVLKTVINFSQRYMIAIPKELYGRITVINHIKDKKWDICAFQKTGNTVGDVLFSIISIDKLKWEQNKSEYDGYFSLLYYQESVIAAKISPGGLVAGIDKELIFSSITSYNAE